jgi:hypothetical protein
MEDISLGGSDRDYNNRCCFVGSGLVGIFAGARRRIRWRPSLGGAVY